MGEKDDFWDVEKLVPRGRGTTSRFSTRPQVTEFTDGVEEKPSGVTPPDERRLTLPRGTAEETTETYTPARHSLIRRITVRRSQGGFDFYDRFRKAALLYYDVVGEEADFVPFYSYMPQYTQLTRPQKDYYFWFRHELRRGEYIRTDYSYLYLYVYEILNLPEKIDAPTGLLTLARLWKTYRHDLPAIDKYFSVWIQDYCMVHRLPPPVEELRDFIPDILPATGFREFYLSDPDLWGTHPETVLACLSDYDWRTGRYALSESREVYRRHMMGALRPVLCRVMAEAGHTGENPSLLVREAFPYSLCTHLVKCRLEVEYYPVADALAIRRTVTAAVRYTENCLRNALGVKSRLAVKDLPEEYRQIIDGYFKDIFRQINEKRRRESAPAYEKQYDAPEETLSFTGASELERASWNTTLRLIDEEDADEIRRLSAVAEPVTVSPVMPATALVSVTAETSSHILVSDPARAYLAAKLAGDTVGERAVCRAAGVTEDDIAAELNAAFSDIVGDIILEPEEPGYRLVEDYREDIEIWLRSSQK